MAEIVLKHVQKVYPNNESKKKGFFGKKKKTEEKKHNLKVTEDGVLAVEDFNLTVHDQEFVVLVGPSGCGKSTTMRMVAGLEDITSGDVLIDGKRVNDVAPKDRDIAMVFQSYALYPHMTVYKNIAFGLELRKTPKDEIDRRVHEAAKILEIEHLLDRKPKALSGGQRQRVGIARAFALKPKLIICDEPVSALDVSIQAQVLNLLKELQDKFGTAYLFIAHDLSVVQHISDRVAVMYLGKMVEVSDWKTLYSEPHHPYTQSLLSAVPVPDPDIQKTRKRIILAGDPPSPLDPPTGCRFHTRCPIAQGICSEKLPEFKEVAPGHCCACHFAEPFPIKESHIDL